MKRVILTTPMNPVPVRSSDSLIPTPDRQLEPNKAGRPGIACPQGQSSTWPGEQVQRAHSPPESNSGHYFGPSCGAFHLKRLCSSRQETPCLLCWNPLKTISSAVFGGLALATDHERATHPSTAMQQDRRHSPSSLLGQRID